MRKSSWLATLLTQKAHANFPPPPPRVNLQLGDVAPDGVRFVKKRALVFSCSSPAAGWLTNSVSCVGRANWMVWGTRWRTARPLLIADKYHKAVISNAPSLPKGLFLVLDSLRPLSAFVHDLPSVATIPMKAKFYEKNKLFIKPEVKVSSFWRFFSSLVVHILHVIWQLDLAKTTSATSGLGGCDHVLHGHDWSRPEDAVAAGYHPEAGATDRFSDPPRRSNCASAGSATTCAGQCVWTCRRAYGHSGSRPRASSQS